MKKHILGALAALPLLISSACAQETPTPPLGYLGVALVYSGGKLIGAKILGLAPTEGGCIQAAEGAVARYTQSPHPAGVSINVGCMPVPAPISAGAKPAPGSGTV